MAELQSPTELSGLAWWLDASDADSVVTKSGNVLRWLDKSPNARHTDNQVDATKRPQYVANVINTKPAIKFDGTNDLLSRAPFIYNMGAHTAFFVIKASQQASESRLFGEASTTQGNPFHAFGTNGDRRGFRLFTRNDAGAVFFNIEGSVPVMDGHPSFLTIRDTFTNYDVNANGYDHFASDYNRDGTISSDTLSIGAIKGGNEESHFDGFIAEIIFYERVLSDVEIASVEAYLKDKWYTDAESFFLLGQSNADGFQSTNRISEDIITALAPIPENLNIYYKYMERTGGTRPNDASFVDNGQWYKLGIGHNDGNRTTHMTVGDVDDGVATGSGKYYGIELEYGRQHLIHNPDVPLFIFKVAINGSAIEAHWEVEAAGEFSIWRMFKEFVYTPGYQDLINRGIRLGRPRIFWMQGESDASAAVESPLYHRRLNRLVERFKTELYDSDPLIIIGGLSKNLDTELGTPVKQAQRLVANANSGVYLLPTDGTGEFIEYDRQPDQVHYSATGLTRMAQDVYHLQRENRAPTEITISNPAFPASVSGGDAVAELGLVDSDLDDDSKYILLNDSDNKFFLNGNKMIVREGETFSAGANHSFSIRARDKRNQRVTRNAFLNVGGDPFEPKYYGDCQGWYDPNDTGTVTLNGSNVSELRDKSGLNRHFTQGTASKQPLRVENSINNNDVVRFDGADDLMTRASFIHGLDETTIFYVLNGGVQSEPFESKILTEGSTASNNPNFTILGINTVNDLNSSRIYLRGDTNEVDYATIGDIAILDNVPTIVCITDRLNRMDVEINGVLDSTASAQYSRTNSTSLTTAALGASVQQAGESNFAEVDLAQLMIYKGIVKGDQKKAVMNYLASRFGITIVVD